MASRLGRAAFARLRHRRVAFGAGVSACGIGLGLHHFQDNFATESSGRVQTTSFNPQQGVFRVDTIVVPSNYPCEDKMSSISIPNPAWSFWSIYDGHVGPQTSTLLERTLIPTLVESLWDVYAKAKIPEPAAIHEVFRTVCLEMDDAIVNKPVALVQNLPEGAHRMTIAASVLQEARAGSCALIAFYEAALRRIHVAVVGDSRAILGRRRRTTDGTLVYDVHVLSLDQNTKNPAEVARLVAAHPDEPKLMDQEKGRLLGWGLTRAFGDGVMKWSRELQTWMEKEVLGDRPRATTLTPPYFTAEPEVTTTDVQPGDFLIMGSDGLWECLTNEEAVGLVGAWVARWGKGSIVPGQNFGSEEKVERNSLPVGITDDKTNYWRWDNIKKVFTNIDSGNVAGHLVRNALGGANRDLYEALLATGAPRSRHIRDDISVIVVFFDEDKSMSDS